jgi:hypothetical protein
MQGSNEQRVVLPPRATEFRVVCEACQARQPETRGYLGAVVEGQLPLDTEQGVLVCARGHVIGLVRESKAAALR